MRKYPLIAGSIVAVVILVLGSLTNVVGYQSVNKVNDSPLFRTRTQRAINQGSKIFVASDYLGKGVNTVPFHLRLRDNRTELIRNFINKIRTMDDGTFNKLVIYAIPLLSQQEKKDINIPEVINNLRQLRKNPDTIILSENSNNENKTFFQQFVITVCWFPGCYVLEFIFLITIISLLFRLQPTSAICGPP
jgi:hypothetical protein